MEVAAASTTSPAPRKVMIVADPTRESAGALQWALSHATLDNDEIVLLYVEPSQASRRTSFSSFLKRAPTTTMSSSPGASSSSSSSSLRDRGGGGGSGDHSSSSDFLEEMRARCEATQPKVQVYIKRVEIVSGDKAATILALSNMLAIDLLVIGQRRSSSTHAFLSRHLSGGNSSDMAEYLIENSKCLCIGVQKRGQNAGYVLNSRTHKNFWLLA